MAGTKKTKPEPVDTILTASAVKRSAKYKAVKKALLEELKKKSVDKPPFTDSVEDYMSLYVVKEMLIDDIERTGVKNTWENGMCQKGVRDNPSVDKLIKVNAQMLKILNELNIKTTTVEVDIDEEL